jgi:hypothetical protein
VHEPQEAAVRAVPQLSVPAKLPQFLPSRAQKAASVSATHAQTFPAVHVCGAVHVPHEVTVRDAPQLSFAVTLPHALPSRVQKAALSSGVHAQTFVAVHVAGAVHVPHEATVRGLPQLSVLVTAPQVLLRRVQNAVSVSATQFTGPHTLPALQTSGAVHDPQEATVRLVPQLSAAVTLPQFLPSRLQNAVFVSGEHAHAFVALHVAGGVHVPHSATVRDAPQLSFAVTLPQVLPSRVQKAASLSGAHMTPPAPPVPPVTMPPPEPPEPPVPLAPAEAPPPPTVPPAPPAI